MESKKLISFDYAMKYILRDKSDYSIIEGFLSALLATADYKPVKVKSFLESESNKDDQRGKRVVADMVVEDIDGVQYIIEIERNERFNFMHKACFSTSKLIADNLDQGQDYKNIIKVIHISLLYFDIGGTLYHGKTIMHEVNTKERLNLQLKRGDGSSYDLHDIFPEYFIISIPAFHDQINRGIDEWLYMMKHESIREDFKEKYIKLAAQRLAFLKMSVVEQTRYMKYRIEMVDVHDGFETSYIQGKDEGLKEGEEKASLRIAKQALILGLDMDKVAQLTGVSLEQISKLKQEIIKDH